MPAFMSGPASTLFTNVDGFSARVTLNIASQPKPITGLLLGRGTRLLFAPDPHKGFFSKRRPADGTSFIWDVADSKGYVVSETMQSYAPVDSRTKTASISSQPAAIGATSVNGYKARQTKATATLSDGSVVELTYWKASDFRDFPVRIKSAEGRYTLNLSSVRLESPSSDVFLPPEGFSQHANPGLMLASLLEREAAIKKKSSDDFPDLQGAPEQGQHQR